MELEAYYNKIKEGLVIEYAIVNASQDHSTTVIAFAG
jgi:hypothetical protein